MKTLKVAPRINVKAAQKHLPEYLRLLKKTYPDTKTALHYITPLEMLVATILSAQCTDVRVNKVTPALFKRFKTPEDYAHAPVAELESYIRSTGFYHNKAKNIQGACRVLIEKFGGKLPRTMAEMLTLPGVARKTANVVLYNVYNVAEGVVVDTHVRRLSQRLGLTAQKSPEKIERELMKIIPKDDWVVFSLLLIDHGRAVCKSQRPLCEKCILNKKCPSAFAFNERGKWIGVK